MGGRLVGRNLTVAGLLGEAAMRATCPRETSHDSGPGEERNVPGLDTIDSGASGKKSSMPRARRHLAPCARVLGVAGENSGRLLILELSVVSGRRGSDEFKIALV